MTTRLRAKIRPCTATNQDTPQAGTTPGAPQSNPPGPGVPPGPGKAARIPHSAPTT